MGRALADPRKGFPSGPGPGRTPFGEHFAQNPYKTCVKMHFGGIFMGRALAGPLKGFFLNKGFFERTKSVSYTRADTFLKWKV